MKRKMIYTLTLFALVILWGVFATAAPVSAQPAAQETVVPPDVTVIAPDVTAIVPVTGDDDTVAPNLMTLLFYGFLGILAIVLLVALFASANRTTVVHRDGPPSDHDHLP